MKNGLRRGIALTTVPALATLGLLVSPSGASPAGASTVGVGVVTAQVTSQVGEGGGAVSTFGTVQITLIGDILAGSRNFLGSASIGSFGYSEADGGTNIGGPEPISGNGVLGSLQGTCGEPGSKGTDDAGTFILNLVCTVSVGAGSPQGISIEIVMTNPSLPLGIGSSNAVALHDVGAFVG